MARSAGPACNILHIAARRASSGDAAEIRVPRAVASAMLTSMHVTDLAPGMSARPLTPDDLDAAYAVYAADELADAGILAIEREDIEGDWARPSFDLARDSIGVLEGDRLLGAAEVTRGGGKAEGAVLPEARGAASGRGWRGGPRRGPRRWAPSESVEDVPDRLMADRFLAARGYRAGHTAWVLQLPEGRDVADRELPEGYSLVTGGPGRPGHGRPTGSCGARSGSGRGEPPSPSTTGRPRPCTDRAPSRGSCASSSTTGPWSGSRSRSSTRRRCGYVHQLAVDRAHRGRGLAQALLADGFRNSRERGATSNELSTDSRTGALDLYLKVGMEVTQTLDLPGHEPCPAD